MLQPRPFTIELTEVEIRELLVPSGDGGHQLLHDELRHQLVDGNRVVTLNDEQMGKLMRYMTQYGSGGFQGRLQRAFRRSLLTLISG